jgi:hypothetical protein
LGRDPREEKEEVETGRRPATTANSSRGGNYRQGYSGEVVDGEM